PSPALHVETDQPRVGPAFHREVRRRRVSRCSRRTGDDPVYRWWPPVGQGYRVRGGRFTERETSPKIVKSLDDRTDVRYIGDMARHPAEVMEDLTATLAELGATDLGTIDDATVLADL